jgi:flagellar biosynthesis/type III secretory pathway M-ring protein FliF/YscJ
MKKNVIIAGSAIAALTAGIAIYLLWKRKKKNEPLLEDFDTHYHNSIAPKMKKGAKHVTNAFKTAKDHLFEHDHAAQA